MQGHNTGSSGEKTCCSFVRKCVDGGVGCNCSVSVDAVLDSLGAAEKKRRVPCSAEKAAFKI